MKKKKNKQNLSYLNYKVVYKKDNIMLQIVILIILLYSLFIYIYGFLLV